MDNLKEKVTSFWERKEGTTGMIIIGALSVAGFFGLKAALPSLITLFEQLTVALGQLVAIGCYVGVIALVAMILLDPKCRAIGSYLFRRFCWIITDQIITIDPIGIMRNYIEDLKKLRSDLKKHLEHLKGQIAFIRNQIAQNIDEVSDSLNLAKRAKERLARGEEGMKGQMALNQAKAGRRQKFAIRLKDLLTKMEFLEKMLSKQYEVTGVVIENLVDEVDVQETERKAMLSGYNAMRAAQSILSGSGEKREMFDRAARYLQEDYANKMGAIENFMTDVQPFINNLDLANGEFDEEAYEKLSAWADKADSIMGLEEPATTSTPSIKVDTVSVINAGEFNKLFTR